ncbi:hypothetical protein EV191_106102 [Tamaricihabitans halophyticus]|uniref:Pyridoxamine 5'-phosphate oxidase n=1 Tax=Tamaricihabitans halophyticus TaxID=1262583 RepID=A0A4R2QTA0_9PSEU|nr:hypothetical protein [Tamaricihabitans halophyticus]TCP51938.1 hypothetical protein EV191_106102 [Tamaricihabitans halophyticus]
MNQPDFDVRGMLDEPGLVASIATVTATGRPALAVVWFCHADSRLWFNSPRGEGRPEPFLDAARRGADVAVLAAIFNAPNDIRQFRATGPARLEDRDGVRVRRVYDRYISEWTPQWLEHLTSTRYQLWSVLPASGMAVDYSGFRDSPVFRWASVGELDAVC